MPTPASLPDDELVRLARAGKRDAFAVLYHRYVRQVHALVVTGSPDVASAEATTVAVFSDLLRHLGEIAPARVAEALEHHATRRIRGHRGGRGIPPLTVGALDRMWREVDRRWPSGEAPPRDTGTMVPVTAGALVAVLVLGALATSSRRGGAPDPGRSFEAVSVRDDLGPALLPELPRPSPSEVEGSTPDPELTIVMPSATPTSDPTVEPTQEPTEPTPTEPTPTEEPDAAPEVSIASPADGSTHRADGQDDTSAYATVEVAGTANDDRDPADTLTYRWSSSADGDLAQAATATVLLRIPDGQLTSSHVLTFSVTDSAGNVATASVTVVVTRV